MTNQERWILWTLVLGGFVLKCLWLGRNELAHDEPFTVLMAHRELGDLFAQLKDENNPPLHFLLMHVWCWVSPLEEAWLRLPSAVFSALAVWPLFLLARALANTQVAVTTALLFTLCNYHFGFAHEVRAYALFTLLTCTAMWMLWRAAHQKPHAILGLFLTDLLLIHIHFLGWGVLGLQGLAVLLLSVFRPAQRPWLISLIPTVLLFIPYGITFLHRVRSTVDTGTWLTAPQLEEVYNMVWRWSNAPVVAVLFLLVITTALVRSRLGAPAITFAMLWAFVPLVALFLASYISPVFLDRYLVFAAPGFALLVAASVEWCGLPHRLQRLGPALAVLAMAATFTPWKANGLRPSEVHRQVNELRAGRDIPLLIQPWWYTHTYAWQVDPQLLTDPAHLQGSLSEHHIFTAKAGHALPFLTAEHDEVLVIDAGAELEDPLGSVRRELEAAYPYVERSEPSPKITLWRYRR